MRKTTLIAAFAIILSMIFTAIPASAAQVNSHEVITGDTVSFDIHAIACPTAVQAIDISIYYDSTSLEYVDKSLKTPALSSAVKNTSLDGEIRINAIDLPGFEFSEDSTIASMEFTVKDDSASDITLYCEVKNFLDENKTELKDTYIYDVTRVNTSPEDITNSSEPDVSVASSIDSKVESTTFSSEEEDIVIDLDSAPTDETVSSSDETESIENDIPSELAIRTDTLDTAVQDKAANKKRYLMILLSGVGIVVLIAIVFRILLKDGSKGSHFSK